MGNIVYTRTRNHMHGAAESALVAYWTNDNYHINSARECVVRALSGTDHGGNHSEDLKEIIATAIQDSLDVGCQPEDAAQGVIDAILDACLPLIEEDAGE